MRVAPATTAKRKDKGITARYLRLIDALLSGPVFREAADKISGASNSPHYVHQLRVKFGLNILTKRVEKTDRDGCKTRPGLYILQDDSVALAETLIKSGSSSEAGE